MTKLRAYIETTIPSYLTAWPSGNLIRAAEQWQTKLWWERRDGYELVGSELLIEECSDGDPDAAADRLKAIEGLPLLEADANVDRLATALFTEVPFPAKAKADATHVALAAVHRVDFLVTWNIRHLMNPVLRKRTESVCRKYGYDPPVICSPAELLGETAHEGN
jgi:hypothetical protein